MNLLNNISFYFFYFENQIIKQIKNIRNTAEYPVVLFIFGMHDKNQLTT